MNDPITNENLQVNAELFVRAAWAHAQSFMAEKAFVPDVMLLGTYHDAQITFVFPSSQSKDDYIAACQHEATALKADIAIYVSEAWMKTVTRDPASPGTMPEIPPGPASEMPGRTEVIWVSYCERGGEIRAEYAPIARGASGPPTVGAVSSMAHIQTNRFLDNIFNDATQH